MASAPALVAKAVHPLLEQSECFQSCWTKPFGQAFRECVALDSDSEQRRVLEGEAAKDEDSRVDQIGHRVLRDWQRANTGAKDFERAVSKRADEPFLRAEEAVDGARGGERAVSNLSQRQRLGTSGLDQTLGRVEQRRGRSFTMLSGPSHVALTLLCNDVTLQYTITRQRNRQEVSTMSDGRVRTEFDTQPPVPAHEYARIVAGVNVGYDLVFTLATCFLRALRQPKLDVLVVGAGGGREIEQFLPSNPKWRLVGVDPSRDMLGLAQNAAERLGVQERVELVHGTIDSLPADRQFDAVTCLYVLHFLPDDAKLALLRGIAARLRPQGALLVVSGARVDVGDLRGDILGIWQQHGEFLGLPAERMAPIIQQILSQQAEAITADDYVGLLRAAGFHRVVPILNVMNGGMIAWIARP